MTTQPVYTNRLIDLLEAWPDALETRDLSAAATTVARARRVAEAVGAITGDRYLADVAAAVQRQSDSRAQALVLARAHRTFRRAMGQYENNEIAEAGRGFLAVRQPLVQAGSPLAMAAGLQIAITAYFTGDFETSTRGVDALIPWPTLRPSERFCQRRSSAPL